jgi:hypothetical protein
VTRRAALLSAAVLFGLYLLLSLNNDPKAFLGTDTGGKVATLRAMKAHHSTDPDIGYWAQRWDPNGTLHPLYYTSHIGKRWINVTTLPALYAALPLYDAFGYRGALVIPMLGGVGCALAAAALARRAGAGDGGRLAFWVVGLASPVVIYALDFWEHTVGLALIAWAVVVLIDLAQRKRAVWFAALAGVLFGAAATMRTEALAYGAVATAVVCLFVVRRQLGYAIAVGALVTAGLAVPLLANVALERAVLGSSLRAERATGTVDLATTTSSSSRVKEAGTTSLSLNGDATVGGVVVGLAVAGAIAAAALRRDWRLLLVPAALYVARASQGFGFVPGFLMAAPIGAVGLALGWRRGPPARLVMAIAVLALPVVWSTQFTGGAAPQWAGRYILMTSFALGVIGIAALDEVGDAVRIGAVALAASVTVFGVAWMHQRTHDVAESAQRLDRLPEPILVSRIAHLVREGGGVHDLGRWLTALSPRDLKLVGRIADETGADRIAVVDFDGAREPATIGALTRQKTTTVVRFLHGIPLRVWIYARSGAANRT